MREVAVTRMLVWRAAGTDIVALAVKMPALYMKKRGSVAASSISIIVDQLILALIGLATIKIVGILGSDAISGTIVAERMFFLMGACLFSVGQATLAFVAMSHGARRPDEVDTIIKSGLCLSIVVAAMLAAIGLGATQWLLRPFNLGPEAEDFSLQFIRTVSPFFIVHGIVNIFSSSLRALGDVITPLKVNCVCVIINICCAYWFVTGAFGLPSMGVAGAALANGLAYSCAALFYFVRWKRSRPTVKPENVVGRVSKQKIHTLIKAAVPIATELFVFNFGLVFFALLLSFYGNQVVASYGLLLAVLNLVYVIGTGCSISTAAAVGRMAGEKNFLAIKPFINKFMLAASVAMSVSMALIWMSAESLAAILNTDSEVGTGFQRMLLICTLIMPLMSIEFIFKGASRGLAQTRIARDITTAGILTRSLLATGIVALGWDWIFIFIALAADYMVRAGLYYSKYYSASRNVISAVSH